MKTSVSLIKFVHDCLWKQFLASNSLQSSSNLFFGQFWELQGFLQSFNLKLEQLSCGKVLNFVLLDSYSTDLFAEIQIPYRKTFKFGPGRFLER